MILNLVRNLSLVQRDVQRHLNVAQNDNKLIRKLLTLKWTRIKVQAGVQRCIIESITKEIVDYVIVFIIVIVIVVVKKKIQIIVIVFVIVKKKNSKIRLYNRFYSSMNFWFG